MSTLQTGRFGVTRSIRRRVLVHITLIVSAVVALTAFEFLADRELQELDMAALREQKLVSTIYDEIGQARDLLDTFISSPLPAILARFQKLSRQLRVDTSVLASFPRSDSGARTVIDFQYMVQSFLEAAARTIENRQAGALAEANDNNRETLSTLNLINRQLADLFQVMNEDDAHQRRIADHVRDEIFLVAVGLGLVVIGLVGLFVGQVLRRIIHPLDELTTAANKVNAGELQIRVKDDRRDFEIGRLAGAFNEMLTTIQKQIVELQTTNELRARLHEEELVSQRMRALAKESELQALQSRINPHFLFNTLNIICQMAYNEHAEGSAALLEALSAMLRYIMADSSKPVAIHDEIRNVQDYIYIQNLRFGQRITFALTYAEEVGTVTVPRLIIQPLVENAINHGVKTYVQDAAVGISVEPIEDRIRIRVTDNGIGMEPKRLEAVRASLAGRIQEEGGIGLRNIHERLKLFFGPSAETLVISGRGAGTTVDLLIPRFPKGLS
jgi:signal transduction histidine kinase